MSNDAERRLLAARGIAETFAEKINDYMRNYGRNYAKLTATMKEEGSPLELDYTESSLYLADFILRLAVGFPDAEMIQPLMKELPASTREKRLDYLLTAGYFYAAEVSTRWLGTEWGMKKGFLSGTQIGLKLPDGGFFSEHDIRSGADGKPMMPRDMYLLKLKPRIRH
jgi:hypothetical protein